MKIFRLCSVVLLLAARLVRGGEAAAPVASDARAEGSALDVRGAAFGFFDDKTGERAARLTIDRIGLEYRHQGFLRVAWRPLVVLDGVTLDLAAGAAWSTQGPRLVETLSKLGRGEAFVLRKVRLRLEGAPAREISAAEAHLRPDGGLELDAATVSREGEPADGPAPVCFWLAGPDAGRWTPVVPPAPLVSSLVPSTRPTP